MPKLNLVEELREHAYHLARGEIVDVRGLEKVIREAADILAKLPTTADGLVVTVDDEVWHASDLRRSYPVDCMDGAWQVYVNLDGRGDKWHGVQVWQCYSTAEAARAAAEGKTEQ
jgi:hypothetical protein